MSDKTDRVAPSEQDLREANSWYGKRDYWRSENLKYSRPHYRMEKAASVVRRLAAGKEQDLLDIGCGPAALMPLLPSTIRYFGIDIAIHNPAPYLIETDFLEEPIGFGGQEFDIAVAQGVFEYVGSFQSEKLAEIRALLRDGGRFLVSYVNFGHRRRKIYDNYNNIRPINEFGHALTEFFVIDAAFPVAHNWKHSEPRRRLLRNLQMNLNVNMPGISPRLAVEYFFLCSPR